MSKAISITMILHLCSSVSVKLPVKYMSLNPSSSLKKLLRNIWMNFLLNKLSLNMKISSDGAIVQSKSYNFLISSGIHLNLK